MARAEGSEVGGEMGEAARVGAGTVRIGGFVPKKMRSHWRVLDRGVTRFTLGFNRITLGAGLRVNARGSRV